MNTELDPNIAALFEQQSAPPDSEQFVKAVSIRIARARRRRILAETLIRQIPAIALIVVIPLVVKILQIVATRLEPALSGINPFAAVPATCVLPGIVCFALLLLHTLRLTPHKGV
jgi:hypothetical protein